MSINLLRILTLFSFIEEKNNIGENPTTKSINKFIRTNFYEGDEAQYNKKTFYRDRDFIIDHLNETLTNQKGWKFETLGITNDFFKKLNRNLAIIAAFKEKNNKLIGIKNIIFDNKISTGVDYFKQILDACEKNQIIEFDYFKFDTQQTESKIFQPHILKEKKNRWYVLGFDAYKTDNYRTFALDRISNLKVSSQKFIPQNYDFVAPYHDAYGMFIDKEAVKVVLQFDKRDGNYLKSNPIHHSQKVKQIENGVEIELFIKPTLDFIMELMSRSWSLKIIEPQLLKEEIANYWKDAIARNS